MSKRELKPLGLALAWALVSGLAWAEVEPQLAPAIESNDFITLAPRADVEVGLHESGPAGALEGVLEVLTTSMPPDGQAVAETTIAALLTPDSTAGTLGLSQGDDEADVTSPPAAEVAQVVYDDYGKAMREAVEDRKLMFVYFYEPTPNAATKAFDQLTLADAGIREKLKRFVVVRLPCDAQITVQGEEIRLLDHPAFSEMLHRQGVAIIDLAHVRAEYYGHVVSTFPFSPGKFYRKEALSIILDLPPGTLTQRTMIYAVRIHPESPASTQGQFHNVLADEAKQQSTHQAAILLQGHHSWDTRFHRISAKLGGATAEEVVAESWPNETLVEACVDCVHSWRQSPGHWGAVRARHSLFGYDIKRGRNGIWYATGIFGRR